ncbi:MAG TPA: LysM peptidoglycan-binding domain-containing protein [Solirubrobacteraceae bacterium]|nr:LysM peptidoglycan-binding domain-containing protein [Solirubrobacteraceae bacterium]
MHLRLLLLLTVAAGALLVIPAAASAYFVHTVAPGESLSSIAAADGLSVDQLAAANGLSPDAELIAGSTVQIPPQQQPGVSAPIVSSTAGTTSMGDGDSDADDVGSTAAAAPASSAAGGSYVVQPGDTLTAIAARAGMTVDQLAALNGLDPNAYLISGTALSLGSGSGTEYVSTNTAPSSAASAQPVGAAAEGTPTDPPYPTPQTVSAPEVGSIAAANGVPASLADAIAWQESGFNNDLVSTADARGVMQILPGTWQWIQNDLNSGPPLAPASASDNVRGGVIMLHSLLDATGGDPAEAAAAYYQGLSSLQQNGMYPDTQQYVQDVLSLESQFGGGGG